MAEKIAIAFDDQAREILENIYPELRNAAVNIAVKMLARDPIYKKYFCVNCDELQETDDATDLENLESNNQKAQNAQSQQAAVVSWDAF